MTSTKHTWVTPEGAQHRCTTVCAGLRGRQGAARAHLASAGVNLTVALAAWRSRKPVVVRQPLQRVARFSASSFSPNAFRGRPVVF